MRGDGDQAEMRGGCGEEGEGQGEEGAGGEGRGAQGREEGGEVLERDVRGNGGRAEGEVEAEVARGEEAEEAKEGGLRWRGERKRGREGELSLKLKLHYE